MPYLIGTDEAGYGPNLGPLTVAGTLWKVPETNIDLYQSLHSVVSAESVDRKSVGNPKLHIADSKLVYQASKKIESLERGVLAMLVSLRGAIPNNNRELIRDLCSKCVEDRVALFAGEHPLWNGGEAYPLPIESELESLRSVGYCFHEACLRSSVGLQEILCQPMFPALFNRSIEIFGNKANVLSAQTMLIVSNLLALTGEDDVLICCDKHGGRSRYLPLIQQYLAEQLVTVEAEGRDISRYSWVDQGRKVTIQFSVKGESQLPVAAGSMVAKYVREVFMYIWNDFWQQHVDNLKPTKGYPVDAKRFMSEIENVRCDLGVDLEMIWRCR